MQRHEVVKENYNHYRGAPKDTWYGTLCTCGEEFKSRSDYWHHQADEYERLLKHYTHLFEPTKTTSKPSTS